MRVICILLIIFVGVSTSIIAGSENAVSAAKSDYFAATWGVTPYQSQLYPNACQSWVVQSLAGSVLPVHVTIRDAVTGDWLVSQSFPGNVDPKSQGGFFVTVSSWRTVQEAHVQVYQYTNNDPTVPTYWLIDTTIGCFGDPQFPTPEIVLNPHDKPKGQTR